MNYHIDWLKARIDQGETIKYIFFWGHTGQHHIEVGKFVFSQWYPAPFTVEGIEYKTSEHWMMAQKALLFHDTAAYNAILKAEKPGEAKEIGRKIVGFDEAIWVEKRYELVKAGNIHKFNQHAKLKDFLLSTADRVLVEASPTDAIWGIGLPSSASEVENPYHWRGLNLLGFALMETRDYLQELS